ncbi:MAG: hypothetical protein WD152_01350, partial [Nitriliruptoraceae bacterium]
EQIAYGLVRTWLVPAGAGLGMLLFLAAATVPMLWGGELLDYAAIEVAGVAVARIRYLGILIVEVAVGLAVFGAILLIFDVLTGRSHA